MFYRWRAFVYIYCFDHDIVIFLDCMLRFFFSCFSLVALGKICEYVGFAVEDTSFWHPPSPPALPSHKKISSRISDKVNSIIRYLGVESMFGHRVWYSCFKCWHSFVRNLEQTTSRCNTIKRRPSQNNGHSNVNTNVYKWNDDTNVYCFSLHF